MKNCQVIDELEANETDMADTSGDEIGDNDDGEQGESDSVPGTDRSMDTEPQNANEIDWKELSDVSDGEGDEQ